MEVDPTRMCELLVGLGDVEVLCVDDEAGEPLRVHVRCRAPRPDCGGCGGRLWSDGERPVELVDLQATPTTRSATPGTPKRPSSASITSPTHNSVPPPSTGSPKISRTPACPQKSTGSAAPCRGGNTRSPTGTPRGSPTPPPKQQTTSSNASNAPCSGSPTSTTTESAPSSTPANPTGRYSTPSPRPKTRRTAKWTMLTALDQAVSLPSAE